MAEDYLYPFDPTGKLPSNKITGEVQNLSQTSWADFFFLVPKLGPYFRNTLKVWYPAGNRFLDEGVDYLCSHWFHAASHQTLEGIYGSITLMDRNIGPTVQLTYQTLGGAWAFDTTDLLQHLIDTKLNPRTTTWEEVVDLPFQFPPIDHEWDVIDLTGMTDVVLAVDRITAAVSATKPEGDLASHLADYNNPHRVSAAQINTYEKPYLDDQLNSKLGKDAIAVDSAKFGGQTVQQWQTFVQSNTGITEAQALDSTFTQLISVVATVRQDLAASLQPAPSTTP